MRNSHTTAQNSSLCGSRDEDYLLCRPERRRWGETLTPQHRLAGADDQNTPVPRESRNHRSRRRLKPQRLFTRAKYSRYHTESESTQLEYMHRLGPRKQGQVDPPVQQPEVSTLVPVAARESSGSARSRLPYAETCRRKNHRTHGTSVARSKRQSWTRKPRLTRKRRTAVHASKHLHSRDPR